MMRDAVRKSTKKFMMHTEMLEETEIITIKSDAVRLKFPIFIVYNQ